LALKEKLIFPDSSFGLVRGGLRRAYTGFPVNIPSDPAHSDESSELFKGLTEPQARAVRTTEGPVLVLAAAGSGKTRVITRRIAYLISCGVPAWSIMALTFTNKAAGEMRERVFHIMGVDTGGPAVAAGSSDGAPSRPELPRHVRGLTITTFHSLCARLLRRFAEPAGLKPDFTIYDSSDQAALMKRCIEALQLSSQNFPPRSVLSAISKAKNDLLDADAFAARAYDFSTKNIAKIYSSYTKALRGANVVDFDDLLLLTAKTLQRDHAVREECQRRWQYLLVDEYQDTNRAQFLIASQLVGVGNEPGRGGIPVPGEDDVTPTITQPNICVVGDPDQAIYGWRGADISNILDFEEHYPKCTTITLGENFRSTAPILQVADTLIRHNKRRKHKDLFTSRKGGDKPEAVLCRDEHHEAQLVTDWFKRLHEPDVPARESGDSEARTPSLARRALQDVESSIAWKEMAVFYRTNALSRVIEDALRGAGIPYTIARGTAFYDREEVKNAIGYLRVVANQADDVSLSRIVNTPARGIGDTSYTKLEEMAARDGVPVFEILRDPSMTAMLSSRSANSIQKFVEMVDGWTAGGTFMGSSVPATLHELVDRVVKESGLEQMYKAQSKTSGSEADAERLDNLSELVSSAAEFELEYDPAGDPAMEAASADGLPPPPPLLSMLRAYLESVALVADADAVDPTQGAVTLMTLHAAKGLEFPAVAMIGLEEGQLPHVRAITSASDAELEEERRLCFVGITRAMRQLLMTAAKYRTMRGMSERTIPSRFLAEIPAEMMIISDQSESFSQGWDDEDQTSGERSATRRSGGGLGVAGLGGGLGEPKLTGIATQYPIGAKVRHPQFGVGVVQSVTPGSNARATISFQGVGTKTLVLEFARLTRLP
jgi:DNA helicase II / ATP-dependent DNA helicase PcrA